MSHIVRFAVEGLAGRSEPFSCELDRHINIFFGLNGCGKTSLLKILHSAMSNDSNMLITVPFRSATVEIFSLNYNRTFIKTIDKSKTFDAQKKFKSLNKRIVGKNMDEKCMEIRQTILGGKHFAWKTSGEDSTIVWTDRYLPTSRLFPNNDDFLWDQMSRNDRVVVSEEQLDDFFAKSITQLWMSYISDLLGEIGKAQSEGLVNILKVVLDANNEVVQQKDNELETSQAYERMKKFVLRQKSLKLLPSEKIFRRKYDEDTTLRRVVHDIDSIEKKIEAISASRTRLEEVARTLFSGGKKIIFSDRAINVETTSGLDINISTLSSGEKHILRLLVETLIADKSSIIIDEPELSLHIDWQKSLVDMMRTLSPNAQLIMATHSPEIMADISDKYIKKM